MICISNKTHSALRTNGSTVHNCVTVCIRVISFVPDVVRCSIINIMNVFTNNIIHQGFHGSGTGQENKKYYGSGKSQEISLGVRKYWNFIKSQEKVRNN